MEELLDRYNRAEGQLQSGGQEIMPKSDWSPRVDIAETDGEFIIKVEIPEVKKDEVKVTVENGVLMIHGERKQEKEEKGKTYHRIERHYGVFNRSFTLPGNVTSDKIKANFKDGVLAIEVKKVPEQKPKAIEVKIND
jgi:HSP20 family protein